MLFSFGRQSSRIRRNKTRQANAAVRFYRPALEQLEDRRVLAAPCDSGGVPWPAPTVGATGVAFTLTNERDYFEAAPYTDPVTGIVYLGVWDDDPAPTTPCWDSRPIPGFAGFTAAATTWISVDALDESDEVHLFPMTQAFFPALGAFDANGNQTKRPTVSGGYGFDTITGSWVGDLLNGGPDGDTIFGNGGNDEIHGMGGHDVLAGGDGNDTITGGDGTDWIFGGADNDTISGNDDFDFLFGEGEIDTINGGQGNDYISGGDGDDTLNGGTGQDIIEGGAGNDTIDGGDGADVLWSNVPGGPIDQPHKDVGGTPGWFDMSDSGGLGQADNDGHCDVEDGHPDDEVGVCGGGVIATPDQYSVSHTGTLNVGAPGILGNDTPTNGTIELIHSTMHGVLSLNGDGSFTYDPNNNFVGKDAFYYNLSSGGVTSTQPGYVVIDVTNAAPSVNGDNMGTIFYNPAGPNSVTYNVLDNDTDPDGDDLDIVDPPGNDIVTTPPQNGTLTVDHESGEITYTYTGPNPGMMPISDSFTYKAKDDWAESDSTATVVINIQGSPLMLDRPPAENEADVPGISETDLALLAQEAGRRWVAAGVDAQAVRNALAGTEFVVADLPGSMLGMEAPGTIVIDVNAAGYGWFVDATPESDEEFSIFVSPSERQAGRGSAALGKADLLTVLMHELGHALGMVHLEGEEFEHSVMNDTLGLSMRRVPTAADILAADAYFAWLWESGSTIRRRRW
ncbi:MAG TPA: Ig-like domain-containing protein [Pirellulaceae bacterium]|nr:Ig-like domain-containing protein [Pirellulaceae bacterium]